MLAFYRVPQMSANLHSMRLASTAIRMFPPRISHEPLAKGKEEADHFVEKLVRLIPSEAVALYLFAQGLIGTGRPVTLLLWSAFCLLVAGLVRYLGSKRSSPQATPQWGAVGIACVSFVIWLYNIGGPFLLLPGLHDPVVASLVIAGWTTLTTIAYEPRGA